MCSQLEGWGINGLDSFSLYLLPCRTRKVKGELKLGITDNSSSLFLGSTLELQFFFLLELGGSYNWFRLLDSHAYPCSHEDSRIQSISKIVWHIAEHR